MPLNQLSVVWTVISPGRMTLAAWYYVRVCLVHANNMPYYHEECTIDILGTCAVIVVNELRSESVHSRFLALFEQHFTIKRTPRTKMDAVHQHSAIDILILKRRKDVASNCKAPAQSTATPSESPS